MEAELTVVDHYVEAGGAETDQYSLGPSALRVESIDQALRFRLAASLNYLSSIAALDASRQTALADLEARLKDGRVSPLVFCLYSKLVAELSKDSPGAADILDDIVLSASFPAAPGVLAFRDHDFADSWWDHFQLLLDTDRQRSFRPQSPKQIDFVACNHEMESALDVMRGADPDWYEELRSLLRLIVLGAPASLEPSDGFNGASTFFLWGAAFINAAVRRGHMSMLDLLVHESSHVLLFGLSAEEALTQNSGEDRYASPVRKDKRPIDGIFHASFVTTRVHLLMNRLLASGSLTDNDGKAAIQRMEYNGRAARDSIDVLARHARPTELGANILESLQEYWSRAPSG